MTLSDQTMLSAEANQQALVDYLRDRDVSCPLCEYNLRGLTSPRCPECGRELVLRVGLSEPRQGAWLLAQVALAAAAGIGLLAIVSMCMHGWPRSMNRQWLFNLSFAYYLAGIPLAVAMFTARRRYLRMPRSRQWTIALIATAVTVMSIVSLAFTE